MASISELAILSGRDLPSSAGAELAAGGLSLAPEPEARAWRRGSFTDLRANPAIYPDWTLRLGQSLDLRELLNQFFQGLKQQLPCSGLVFQHAAYRLQISLGASKAHTLGYRLTSPQMDLGQVLLSRATPFDTAEIDAIEALFGWLYYPLRNALLYQAALNHSRCDALTGLANRAAFDLALKRDISLAKRHRQPLSLIVADADHFKAVNDRYGHQTGDAMLKHLAETLRLTLRDSDQIFRIGGEEFVLLLANTDSSAACIVAERARLAMAAAPLVRASGSKRAKAADSAADTAESAAIAITLSLGIACLQPDDTRESLFYRADAALYAAKAAGRNRVWHADTGPVPQAEPDRLSSAGADSTSKPRHGLRALIE